jgi:hypothetical protein
MRDTTKWLVAAAAAVAALVVAGLQISTIPHGTGASAMAITGFVIALLGVALIVLRATSVLSGGYTTLGELSDLRRTPEYRRQLKLEEDWGNTIFDIQQRIDRSQASDSILRFVLIPSLKIRQWYLRAARRVRIRHARSEGVRVDLMLDYLDRDTFFFSNGLATNIIELYDRLENTDVQVLFLRGDRPSPKEWSGRDPGEVLAELVDPGPGSLNQAEWRLDRLEAATGQIIAFANQRVMEHRFERLKRAVIVGGLGVAAGVALFVVAPKLAVEQALDVTKLTPVSVRLVAASDAFGPNCPVGSLLTGVAVGGTWDEPIVATDRTDQCDARQLALSTETAIVVPQVKTEP